MATELPTMSQPPSAASKLPAASNLPVTVYTPDSPLRHPGKLVRSMLHDLVASRGLAWRLFVRDTSAMYRQSMFGYVWAFLPAIATTVTFVYLNSQSIMQVGETTVPYPAFVMIGTILWQAFLDALNSPLKAVTSAKAMLTKINFPRESLILGGMAEVMFNFLVRALLLVPVFIYYELPLTSSLLLVPLGIAMLMLLGLAFGMLITPIGLLYGDVGRGVLIISSFWMLLTPVVYPPPESGVGAWLAQWNPVSPVLLTTREWMISDPVTHLSGFVLVSLITLATLLLGWLLYRLSMPILIERMGG